MPPAAEENRLSYKDFVRKNWLLLLTIIIVLACTWIVLLYTGAIVDKAIDDCNKHWQEQLGYTKPDLVIGNINNTTWQQVLQSETG